MTPRSGLQINNRLIVLTESSENVSLCIDQCLALLLGNALGQLAHILFDDVLQLQHDRLTGQDRGLAPGLVSCLRGFHSCLHFALGGLRDPGDYLIGGRIVEVDPVLCLRLDELAIDEELGGGGGRGETTTSDLVQALINNLKCRESMYSTLGSSKHARAVRPSNLNSNC